MTDRDWTDYESGPFCRHWSDPADCDKMCAGCGHGCTSHYFGDGESACADSACDCAGWVEPTESESPL